MPLFYIKNAKDFMLKKIKWGNKSKMEVGDMIQP